MEQQKLLRNIPKVDELLTLAGETGRLYDMTEIIPPSAIRDAIREELDNASFVPSTEKPVQPQVGDVDDNVLGFLWSLQNDA